MVELSVKIGGIDFKNPFWLASGLPGDNGRNLERAADAGAGAVITKTMLVDEFTIPKCGRIWLVDTAHGKPLPLQGCKGCRVCKVVCPVENAVIFQ